MQQVPRHTYGACQVGWLLNGLGVAELEVTAELQQSRVVGSAGCVAKSDHSEHQLHLPSRSAHPEIRGLGADCSKHSVTNDLALQPISAGCQRQLLNFVQTQCAWHRSAPLQTKKKGSLAASMTKEEFEHMLELIQGELDTMFCEDDGVEWRFSWDNASAHLTDKQLPAWLSADMKWYLPKYSPDMHKVIEHFFHRLKKDFLREVAQRKTRLTPEAAQSLLRRVAMAMPKEHIAKDVRSLKYTYQAIAADLGKVMLSNGRVILGSGGGYPQAHLR